MYFDRRIAPRLQFDQSFEAVSCVTPWVQQSCCEARRARPHISTEWVYAEGVDGANMFNGAWSNTNDKYLVRLRVEGYLHILFLKPLFLRRGYIWMILHHASICLCCGVGWTSHLFFRECQLCYLHLFLLRSRKCWWVDLLVIAFRTNRTCFMLYLNTAV